MVPDKAIVEPGVGVGGAVGGHQQLLPLKIGGLDGDQLDLHRPLAQLALPLRFGLDRSGAGAALQGLGGAAGAAAGELSPALGRLGRLGGLHRRLVVGGGLPLLKGDGSGGAGGQTVPQAVAVVLPGEPGHPVHHLNGPLVAGGGTGPAAVALALVNANDLADHKNFLLARFLRPSPDFP